MSDGAGTLGGGLWADADDDRALQRYRSLVDAVGDGIYQLDADARFVAVSDDVVEVTGYAREELLGEHVSIVLEGHDGDRVNGLVRDLVTSERTERVETIERPVRTADGETVHCEHQLTPVPGDTGNGDRDVAGVIRLSEPASRDGAEAARPPDHTLANLLDEADEIGVFVLDSDFKVAWLDETIERYFGIDKEAIIGRDKRRVIEETIADRLADGDSFVDTILATYDDNTYLEQFECRVTAGDDREERWLEHLSKPIESGPYAGGRVELYYDITDQRHSEDVHQKTEESFETLVDAVEEYAIFRLDPEGHIISWNEGAREIKGYDAEEILGEHFSAFYTEDDQAAGVPEQNLERATEQGSVEDEGWRVRKDETQFWANVTIAALRDDDGGHRGYLKVTRDMTGRYEREQALKSELSELLGRVTDAFYALDEEWRFTHVNDRAEELIDFESEGLVGKHIWETFVWAADSKLREEYERAMETQEPVHFELYYPEPLDAWYEINAYPSETGLSVYFRDITERKEHERDLELFRTLLDYSSDAVFVVDPETGRILDVNDTATRQLGYDRDELTSLMIPDIDTELPSREAWRSFVRELRTAESTTFQGEIRRKDGSTFPVEVNATYVELDQEYVLGIARDVTERREMEAKLREREERFRQIAEHIEEVFWMTPPDKSEMTYVSPAYEEIWGRSRESLYEEPTSFIDAVHPEDRERIRNALDRQPEGEYDEEYRIVRPDGEVRWVRDRAFPIQDDDGEVYRIVGVAVDITERKQLEVELKESERRHRTLVENFPGAVGLFDEDLEYTAGGGQYFEETDVSPDERIGYSIHEAYPDDFAEKLEPRYRAALEGEATEFEVEFNDRYLRMQSLPIENAAGGVDSGMVVAQDVTERKEHEQALQESKNQLRALIDVLPVAVFVAEADGEIVEWNEAAEEIWGGEVAESESISEYEAYEAWWADTGEPVEPHEWPLARALEGEEVTDADEIKIKGFDGEYRTVLNHGMPVRDADGEVSRAVVTLVDITERKEYQRKLEESNERLEQFAYAASHDLQEPLRMVSSYLQLLDARYGDDLDEDAEEFLEFAVDGAERMRQMIDGLLEYSRIESRGDPFEPVNLDEVLEDSRKDLQVTISESDAEITAESLPVVEGDADQLRQVFQNLVENAIEYSGDESPRITITAKRSDSEWIVSVTDEGIGIPPDDQERIFEVFQRLHTDEGYEGTGIGLALCKRIVERHGGDVWVDSELDEGTTISFTLPAEGPHD